MGRDKKAEFSFEARWGDKILDAGITTIPTVVVKHMGGLGLTNGEFTLVVQAFSFKWTGENPYPSAATLADRMGTTKEAIWQLTHSLKEKGYLRRECIDERRGLWTWNFGGLLTKALELETESRKGPPDPEGSEKKANKDETKGKQPTSTPLAPTQGGALAMTQGGALAPAKAETETVRSEAYEEETTTAQPPGDTPSQVVPPADGKNVVVDDIPLLKDLLTEGIAKKQAVMLVTDYDHEAIEKALNYVRGKNGTIPNHAGFIMDAVRKGWNLTLPTDTNEATYTPPSDLWEGFEPLTEEEQREQAEAARVGIQSLKEALARANIPGWTEKAA